MFRKRSSRNGVDPLRYLIQPQETAVVAHAEAGYRLTWQREADLVRISVRDLADADVTWQFLTEVADMASVLVGVAETAVRPLFRLQFSGGPHDGSEIEVAERFVPLAGTVNFRDVGGYETENGRFVRWGQVYRAGLLTNLTDADQGILRRLGIRTVCDVRTTEEAARRPDRLGQLTECDHVLLPLETVDRFSKLRALGAALFWPHRLFDVLHHGYLNVVLEQNPQVVYEIFNRLARSERLPTIIHCTAGKDRTGVMAALLLTMLGVSRETIIADYTLSNQFYDYFRESLQPDVQFLTRFGITIDDLWPFLVVDGEILRQTFVDIDERYGSVTGYLTKRVGVETAVLAQIRKNLLI